MNYRSLRTVELERNPAKQPKRAYYLCIEYLIGRTFDNALLNLGLKNRYHGGISKLGFNLEGLLNRNVTRLSETVVLVVWLPAT